MPPRKKFAAHKYSATSLQRFGQSLLTASGLAEDRARDVAEVLLEADLLGHTTHGFALLPAYLKELKDGMMEKAGEPKGVADHGSALTWDGRYLPGPWLVRRAIAATRERLSSGASPANDVFFNTMSIIPEPSTLSLELAALALLISIHGRFLKGSSSGH